MNLEQFIEKTYKYDTYITNECLLLIITLFTILELKISNAILNSRFGYVKFEMNSFFHEIPKNQRFIL